MTKKEILIKAIKVFNGVNLENDMLDKDDNKVYKIWPSGKMGYGIAVFEVLSVDINELPVIRFAFTKGHRESYNLKATASDIGTNVFLNRRDAERALERKKCSKT